MRIKITKYRKSIHPKAMVGRRFYSKDNADIIHRFERIEDDQLVIHICCASNATTKVSLRAADEIVNIDRAWILID